MLQTFAVVASFQAPVLDCMKNTRAPGFTRAAAHIHGETIAHWYLSMVEPAGSAARMDASVHSPAAREADVARDVGGVFAAPALDGEPCGGVRDGLAPLEEADEHPVRNASPMPLR